MCKAIETVCSEIWIPVEDYNPKECGRYLITTDCGTVDVAYCSDLDFCGRNHTGKFRWWPPQYTKVVAWMPLPEPYKEVNNGTD